MGMFIFYGLALLLALAILLAVWPRRRRPMAIDLRGRSKPGPQELTQAQLDYLAACNKDGYRFAIVPDEKP